MTITSFLYIYIIIIDELTAFLALRRTFKTKWWDALKNDASLQAVKQYFLKHPTQASVSDDMSQGPTKLSGKAKFTEEE